MYLTS